MRTCKGTSRASFQQRSRRAQARTSWQIRFTRGVQCGLGVPLLLLLLGTSFAMSAPRVQAASSLIVTTPGAVFASSDTLPLLQFPEGITSWEGHLFVATFNVTTPADSRIFVFQAATGKLLHTIGGQPGQALVSAGLLLGLTIDRQTGDLFVGANGTGQILRIQDPASAHPKISLYTTFPAGGGPEDLAFFKDGTLFVSDSNLGAVYAIPPGGGPVQTVIAPGNPLLVSPLQGLSPNGLVFSRDWHTLYVANTWADSVLAFGVDGSGHLTDHGRLFAQLVNPDLEEYPTGFDGLVLPDTRIGKSASTPLNGPDGLALDREGHLWVASALGDNLTVLDEQTGQVVTTYGTSAVTAGGLLNNPAGMTFVDGTVYCSNLGIFTGLAGTPVLPFRIVSFPVGLEGAGGNGNW